jgi:hypothetical protein
MQIFMTGGSGYIGQATIAEPGPECLNGTPSCS